jgi:D-3-phosphoglycerate dehydrogenase
MITAKEIAKMKDGVILINVARGGLYNEADLYDALRSGKVAMAGIDVFAKEPATDNPLLDLDNVTVTPHLGANTRESQQNIALQAAENAILAARGISYPNALNLPIKESELPDFVRPYLELAQKIGFMGAQLSNSGIKSIKMSIEGPVSDYIDSLSTFAVVGTLRGELGEEAVNYVNAQYIAKERGLEISKETLPNTSGFKNLMTLRFSTQGGNLLKISSTVFGESQQRIVDIDGYTLDLEPKGRLILFKNNDEPGVIGDVGHTIAKHNINIADFRLGRDTNGQALAVVRVDDEITGDLIEELSKLPACISVRSASI